MADVEQTLAVDPIPLMRRGPLVANLRALADRLETLSTETPRDAISDLAIEVETVSAWLSGARERLLEYRRTLNEGSETQQ